MDAGAPDGCPCRRCPLARAAGSDLDRLLGSPGFSGTVLDAPVDTVLAALPLLDVVAGVAAAGPVVSNNIGAHHTPVGMGGPLVGSPHGIGLRVNPTQLRTAVVTDPVGQSVPTLRFFDAHGDAAYGSYLLAQSDRLAFESLALIGPSIGVLDGIHLGEPPLRPPPTGTVDDQISMFDAILHDGGCERGAALMSGTHTNAREISAASVIATLSHATLMSMQVTTCTAAAGCLAMRNDKLDGSREYDGVVVLASATARTMINFAGIGSAWVTVSEGARGPTSAIELYDHHGRCCFIVTITGVVSESAALAWEQLLADVKD